MASHERRTWSRNYRSSSHDHRWWSHDRRSRSRDRRSLSRNRRSVSRDSGRDLRRDRRLRSRSRSPRHRLSRERSRDQRYRSPRRRRLSSHPRRERSVDSEDDLEVLKRKALASMKQQTAYSQLIKPSEAGDGETVPQQQTSLFSTYGDVGEGGEIDMDVCSISSVEGGNIEFGGADRGTGKGVEEKVGGVGSSNGSVVIAEGCGEVARSSGDSVEIPLTTLKVDAKAVQVDKAPANNGTKQVQLNHIAQDKDDSSDVAVAVVDATAVEQPIGRSVSAPTAHTVAKHPKPLVSSVPPPPAVAVRKSSASAITNQASMGVAPSRTATKVAGTVVQSLKKSSSRPTSHPCSKSNSPALSPIYVPSPSSSTDSVGGGVPSDRVRPRSGSCVKVCSLFFFQEGGGEHIQCTVHAIKREGCPTAYTRIYVHMYHIQIHVLPVVC